MTTAHPTALATPRWLTGLAVVFLLCNLAGLGWLIVQSRRSQTDLAERLDRLEQRVRIQGYEQTTVYPGSGFNALLDHLTYWSPWLLKGKPGTTDRFFVQDRIDNIVEAMAFLPDGFDQIRDAFLAEKHVAGDSSEGDEVRRWLLAAALAADRKRGEELLAEVLAGKKIEVSPRLRVAASRELLSSNKKLAGEVLHEILSIRPRAASGRPGSQGDRLTGQQVFNFIDDYVASGHPGVEKTLIKMLHETEYHEAITIQRCVEALGKLKSRNAVDRIKKLYWQQAPIPGQVPNAIFRRKCMMAVVDTIGAEAVDFLKEIDRKESDAGIRAKLNDYKKQFDFESK